MKQQHWSAAVVSALAVFAMGASSPAFSAAGKAGGGDRITVHGIIGIGGDDGSDGEGIIGIGGDDSSGGEGIIGIGGDDSSGGEGIIGIGGDDSSGGEAYVRRSPRIGDGSFLRARRMGIIGIGGDDSSGGEAYVRRSPRIGDGSFLRARRMGIIGIGGDDSSDGEGIIGIGGDDGSDEDALHVTIGAVAADDELVVGGTLFEANGMAPPRGRTVMVVGHRDAAGLTGRARSARSLTPLAGTVASNGTVMGVPVFVTPSTVGGSLFGAGSRVSLSGYFTDRGFTATRVDSGQTEYVAPEAFGGAAVVMGSDPLAGLGSGATVSADLWTARGTGSVTAYGIAFDLTGAEWFGAGSGLYRLEGELRNGTVVVSAAYPAD